jgi:hypothetical protein
MATLPGSSGPLWHLIEKPRAPFHCDVCGTAIPDDQWGTFTTLPKMYYDTPPSGFTPCNRAAGFDAMSASYSNTVDAARGRS